MQGDGSRAVPGLWQQTGIKVPKSLGWESQLQLLLGSLLM